MRSLLQRGVRYRHDSKDDNRSMLLQNDGGGPEDKRLQGLLPCVKDGEKDEDGAEHKLSQELF